MSGLGQSLNLLRYPDGERRALQRTGLLAALLGGVGGAVVMLGLTWLVQDAVRSHALARKQQQVWAAEQAERARFEKMQVQLHQQRLRWQSQVKHMLDQQARMTQVWQWLAQVAAQNSVVWTHLQWGDPHWSLQGRAASMDDMVRAKDQLQALAHVHGELKAWVAPAQGERGEFQLELTWPSETQKP